MKLIRLVLVVVAVLSVFAEFCEAKWAHNKNDPSYNPLPSEWRSGVKLNRGTGVHSGPKFFLAQKRMYIQNTYKDNTDEYFKNLSKRKKGLKRALRTLEK